MKYFFYITYILLGIFIFQTSNANNLVEIKFLGHKMKFIEYRVGDPNFDIRIGVDTKGGSSVLEIAKNFGAITGINGVFECPKDYTECGGENFTINERYIGGKKIATYDSTGDRVVFGWDQNRIPLLFQTNLINSDKEDQIWEGFANFPLLLKDGKNQIERYVDLGLIDTKMTGPARRSFICSTRKGDKIYFGHVYNIGVDWMSLLLSEFGCYNALNLDAGFSTGFVYNGKYIAGPGREILDGVFIVPKKFTTQKLELRVENIMSLLKKYLSTRNSIQANDFKKRLHGGLNRISETTYAEFSMPYNRDGLIIGEQTNISSTSTLKKLYLINRLRDEIKKL